MPEGVTIPTTKRLTFTLTVSRQINPNYVYMVALRPSTDLNPTDQGPVPVIGPPWGNGFVAGNVTHFVSWDVTKNPHYILYQFADLNLINFFAFGVPINYIDPSPSGRTLQFDLDLSQLASSEAQANTYQSLQVNFLTMDHIPAASEPGGSKAWDALGDSRIPSQINDWVTIPLRTSGTYNNARAGNLEPTGDVADPDLDLSDWSVTVQDQ